MAVELATELLPARGGSRPGEGGRARVLVTRAADQADELAEALRAHDLEPVLVPAIAIELDPPGGELDRAAAGIEAQDWVVVTSPNGARAIVAAAQRVGTDPGRPRWAAMGTATARPLGAAGIAVTFRPDRANGRSMASGIPVAAGERVLVVRADLAGGGLAVALRARGAVVDDVVGYRTRPAPVSSRPLLRAALAAGAIDAVILASGSAVRGLVALAAAEDLDVTCVPAVCIGPETRRAAEEAGFDVIAESRARDARSLAAATAVALIPARWRSPDARP
jgi:uroporphyrinogen-III synthase